jgi:hypothetical protein
MEIDRVQDTEEGMETSNLTCCKFLPEDVVRRHILPMLDHTEVLRRENESLKWSVRDTQARVRDLLIEDYIENGIIQEGQEVNREDFERWYAKKDYLYAPLYDIEDLWNEWCDIWR